MYKYLIIFLLLCLVSCDQHNKIATQPYLEPDYTMLDEPWIPTSALDRYENVILEFEKQDLKVGPVKGGIVFTGSSTIARWKSVTSDLAPLQIINRGFGGSSFPDVIHYTSRIIVKYRPKVVVVYCENDLFESKNKTVKQVRDEYVKLTKLIRESLPDVRIYGISLKPSPARWKRKDEVIEVNKLIKEFIKTDSRHEYIDVWPAMIKNGQPDGSIFTNDSLHMNKEGYDRWIKIIKPILAKNF